jgi:hypothetical protein
MFLLIAGISWWRGHVVPPLVLASLGILLVVPGAVAPALLGPVQRLWMRAGMFLGEVNGRIILTVLFYLVIFPLGRILRLFRDPLDRSLDQPAASNWVKRPTEPVDPARYERQF